MIYMCDYDTSYWPSMPVAKIIIGRALTLPTRTLTALIDSGADGSIIPLLYLQEIHARKVKSLWMRTVTGKRSVVDMYVISMHVGAFEFRERLVIGGVQRDEIIIGRDILNQFVVTLNGLASTVEIAQ